MENPNIGLFPPFVKNRRSKTTVLNLRLPPAIFSSMKTPSLFEALSDEQQAAYEKEAMQRYDPEIVKASAAKWKRYSPAQKQRIGEEGDGVYRGFVAAIPQGPRSPEARACVDAWRKHMDHFWTPSNSQLLNLANTYVDDPRFRANFDRIDPRLAVFVREAVAACVAAR